MYFARLFATVTVAAALAFVVFNPTAPGRLAGRAIALAPKGPGLEEAACPAAAAPIFTSAFADIDDVISISPLGGVTAPGEPLPAPFVRVNTKSGETAFQRRQTQVRAPAKADLTAIERRIVRDADGVAVAQSWTAHFVACDDVTFQLGDLDLIDADIIRRVGGVAAFAEVTGPDHTAVATRIRLRPGAVIGVADGFDVSLEDARAPAKDLVRPERYETNPYLEARILNAPSELLKAIAFDHTHARCPLAYMPSAMETEWSKLLGGAFGMRKAKGENACRTALLDAPGTAQGAWFTDAANNGLAAKVSAVALAPDAIDPGRHIFALHGRLRSLSPDMVALTPKQATARAEAAKDFLSFDAAPTLSENPQSTAAAGVGLQSIDVYVNRPFAETTAGPIYCYQGLRANFVGPRINGVILLQVAEGDEASPATMTVEARADAQACADVERPWAFSGGETTFYR
ncbi:MAG: hypothetical protein AAFX08_08820 [Pseudomonadota bacterium]